MYDFEEYFHICEELSKKSDESHIRSAINRDYYALFGESRKYLVEIRGKKHLKTKKRNSWKSLQYINTVKRPD